MRRLRPVAILFLSVALLHGAPVSAKTLTVLTAFTKISGEAPEAALLAGRAGVLYGTTLDGGTFGYGTAFELMPPAPGQKVWTESVIASFNKADGEALHGGLIADKAGNLYGVAAAGGTNGDGLVFELTPPAPGQTAWVETVLYSFSGTDGGYPAGSLLFDDAGNLYGTCAAGGPAGDGNVFELSPPGAGQTSWTEKVLVSFTGIGGAAPGGAPHSNLIADKVGDLFGTAEIGGSSGRGIVFELTPPVAGHTAWTETVLLTFDGTNSQYPIGGLIADKSGNLYGTTAGGSDTYGAGTVFALSPPAKGQTSWTPTIIFAFNGTDGYQPLGSLIADKAGNLYGTTSFGGTDNLGTVFELSPPASGQTAWTQTILYALTKKTGGYPAAGLIANKTGQLFGTNAGGFGNPSRYGTVFRLKP